MGRQVLTAPGNPPGQKHVSIGAHRGAHSLATENTRAAFEAAIRPGVDFIETDVRRTMDGVLVLHHDPQAFQMPIAQSGFRSLLELCRTRGADLTTLEELLQLASGRIRLDIELKEPGYEDQVVSQIRNSGMPTEDFVITTFFAPALAAFKALWPEVHCGLLIEQDRNAPPGANDALLPQRLREAHADFVAAEAVMVTPGFAGPLKAMGYPICVWTVDDPAAMAKFFAMDGVQAVITNRPEVAIEVRSNLGREPG